MGFWKHSGMITSDPDSMTIFFPFPSLSGHITVQQLDRFCCARKETMALKTSDAGSRYRRRRVGRGIKPPSIPHASHIHKIHLKRSFSHFSTRVQGPTDRPTDQRMDKASYRVACPQLKTRHFCHQVFPQFIIIHMGYDYKYVKKIKI